MTLHGHLGYPCQAFLLGILEPVIILFGLLSHPDQFPSLTALVLKEWAQNSRGYRWLTVPISWCIQTPKCPFDLIGYQWQPATRTIPGCLPFSFEGNHLRELCPAIWPSSYCASIKGFVHIHRVISPKTLNAANCNAPCKKHLESLWKPWIWPSIPTQKVVIFHLTCMLQGHVHAGSQVHGIKGPQARSLGRG